MTDETLRQLQRRYEQSGSEADELAWILGRVRAGEALEWEPYSRLAELDVEAAADYLRARLERGDLERNRLERASPFHKAAWLTNRAISAGSNLKQGKRGLRGRPARRYKEAHRLPADAAAYLDATWDEDRVRVAIACATVVGGARHSSVIESMIQGVDTSPPVTPDEFDIGRLSLDVHVANCIGRAGCALVRLATDASLFDDDYNDSVWEDCLDAITQGARAMKIGQPEFLLRVSDVMARWLLWGSPR